MELAGKISPNQFFLEKICSGEKTFEESIFLTENLSENFSKWEGGKGELFKLHSIAFYWKIFFFNLSNIEIYIDGHLPNLKFYCKDHRKAKSKGNSFEILCQFWIWVCRVHLTGSSAKFTLSKMRSSTTSFNSNFQIRKYKNSAKSISTSLAQNKS